MTYDIWITKNDKDTWVGQTIGTPALARRRAEDAWPEMEPHNILLIPHFVGERPYVTFEHLMGRPAR